MKKLKIGWVGSGFIGQVAHLVNYVQIPNAEIVALAELRPKLGHDVCTRYAIPKYYKDHLALLEDPEIEAVVAIVHRHHVGPVALDILNAGKHLFTEKPMAQTYEKARELADCAKKNNLIYSVGFMRRHDPGVQLAKKLLSSYRESGELGEILSARFYLSAGGDYCNIDGDIKTDEPKLNHVIWPTAPEWVPEGRQREYENFVNVCSHDLNLVRYMFDQRPSIKYVDYRRKRGSIVVMDFGSFSGSFEWGDTNQPTRWKEGVEVIFERGYLTLDLAPGFLRNQPAKVEVYKDNGRAPGEIIIPTSDWAWAFRKQDEAFVNDVLSGSEPIASGSDSVNDHLLIDDIWRQIVAG